MLVYGWTLANSNSIYQRNNRSIKMISMSHLLADMISHEFGQDVSSSSLDALHAFLFIRKLVPAPSSRLS